MKLTTTAIKISIAKMYANSSLKLPFIFMK